MPKYDNNPLLQNAQPYEQTPKAWDVLIIRNDHTIDNTCIQYGTGCQMPRHFCSCVGCVVMTTNEINWICAIHP